MVSNMRRNIIWSLILVVLSVYYFLFERANQTLKKEEENEKYVFVFDPNMVREVSVSRNDEHVVLVVAQGRWQLTKPEARPVDKQIVEDFLMALKHVIELDSIDGSPEVLSSFGLLRPRIWIQVKTKEPAHTETFLIGNSNPAGTGVYGKFDDSEKVILIGSLIIHEIGKVMYDVNKSVKKGCETR